MFYISDKTQSMLGSSGNLLKHIAGTVTILSAIFVIGNILENVMQSQ